MPFVLSAIVAGHKKDVRCVNALSDGSNYLVTGSRDGSAKIWAPQPIEKGVAQQWHCVTTFAGHKGFVSSVTSRLPDDIYPNGLIYTGCQDGIIRAYDAHKSDPVFTLEGHSANVVSLFVSKTFTLLSGSWDNRAKVWVNEREVLNLSGHSLGVWAGIILPETGIMVTGSADKTIRLWKAGKCKKILEHHTQSVRDLAVVSSTEFLSCANDHLILMFKIMNEEGMDCEVVFRYEDVDYIYSLAIRNPATGWVASGEHIGLRVFDNGDVADFLPVPTSSVWSTCVFSNGDIAAACSDAKVYIFTQDPARAAPEDIQAVFQAEVDRFTKSLTNGAGGSSGSTLPAEVGGVKIDDIPGPEALNFPGKRDGMTKMIREGNTISIHSWSQATGEWSKVGDMITDPDKSGQSDLPNGKTLYEGKEYDYIFNIDIDDNVVLKMPYNNDQDPYQVAQAFIHKHELPQSYLDEIANFIFKNASNPGNVANLGQYCDPFTGSGAYVSGSGGVPTAKDYASGTVGVAADPFTGSGAYVSGSGGVPTAKDYGSGRAGVAMDPFTGSGAYVSGSSDMDVSPSNAVNDFFPLKTCLSFSQLPKMDALKSKLVEFNGQVSEDKRLSEEDVIRLTELPNTDKADHSDVLLLIKVLRWPPTHVFPCLDIARLALLNPNVCQCITAIDEAATDFLENIIGHVKDTSRPVNQMLALKVLANAFSSPTGSNLMVKLRAIIFAEMSTFLPTDNKNVQVGLATILLNYSVIACQDGDSEAQVQCINVAFLLLEGVADPESKFRTLVALGTLLSASEDARKAAIELDLGSRIRTWKEIGGAQKIVDCANFVLKI